jgi:hypothetical protein
MPLYEYTRNNTWATAWKPWHEGWHRVVRSSTVNALRRFILRRPPPLPVMDIW